MTPARLAYAALTPLRHALNWLMRPPDFPACDWANKTGGDE